MRRLLREPLLHFLALGALLFLAFGLRNRASEPGEGRIVVTRGRIETLRASFGRVWQRPPSPAELDGLIQDYIREEVLAREAMALGLDKDDTVVRRRLRQKMEFISDDLAVPPEPTDEDLGAYLKAHPDEFRIEPSFTFRHAYLSPERHGANLERDAARLRARLNQAGAGADASARGDPFLLEHEFESVPASEVRGIFGEKFAAALGALPPGRWQGPVESGYGAHLVLVTGRTEGRVPDLAEVRDAVRREWAEARRQEANESFYRKLLGRYQVTIERPAPGDGEVAEVGAK